MRHPGSLPHVPARQWVLSLPIPLRLLLAAQPKPVTPVLQVVHRVIARHLLGQAALKADEADSGAITQIQRFGSAANLNIHLHYPVLDGVAQTLTEYNQTVVEVAGHTDNVGSDAYNQTLSVQRATSVANYLMGKGLNQQRFIVTGAGESRPVASNDTEAGRAANRRVEFHRTDSRARPR